MGKSNSADRVSVVCEKWFLSIFAALVLGLAVGSVNAAAYLEIIGPDEVAEDFTTQYQAIMHYDIGSPTDVTGLAEWSVEPDGDCNIAAGVLTTEVIDLPGDVTIRAQ